MKNKMKKILALLLAAATLFALCACGDKDEKSSNKPATPAATAAPEYVYTASFTPVKADKNNSWLDARMFTDRGFYTETSEVIGDNTPEGVTPEYENQYAVWGSFLNFVDFDGNMTRLEGYKPLTDSVPADEESADHDRYSYTQNSGVTPDGDLLFFENLSENWSDAPDTVEKYSDQWYEYYRYTQSYYIRILNAADGSEKSCAMLKIPEEIASPTDGSYFYPYGVDMDADGNIILVSERKILIFDVEGNMTASFDLPGDLWAEGMTRLADGRLCVNAWGGAGYELYNIDVQGKKLGEKVALPNAYNAFSGGGDYDIYYNDGMNFCGFDIETGESKTLFNWINCDVNGDQLTGVNVLSDGTIVALSNTWDKNYENVTSEIIKVTKVPYSSVPHKDVITLATQYLDWNIRDDLIKFNRSHDNVRIEVIDYSQYNTEEDYSAGLTKLRTELMAGTVPDIIDLNGLSLSELASKGILEDLYPYIDADTEFSREDFFPNVLEALEYNGQLLSTCSGFYISTVLGAASVVGSKPGWTYDELFAALETMPEDCKIFDYYMTRDTVLNRGVMVDMDSYVNWDTGEVNFDSDSFKDLLRFAAKFPAEFDWEHYDYSDNSDDSWTLLSQGRQMLTMSSVMSLDEAGMYEAIFGEQGLSYVGFPTENGTGNTLGIVNGYALSKNCANKEGAWEFLRSAFSVDGQLDQYYLPSNIKAYEAKLANAMTPQYATASDAQGNVVFQLDEDGNRVRYPRGSYYLQDGTEVKYYELSQEQADKIWELITTTTKVDGSNDSIYPIVAEQAEAFFQGQKSPDEVARLIQSKVKIFVNEQR